MTKHQEPLIIFLHLPKTAGTTLARIIERQYEPQTILHLYESNFGVELTAVPATRMDLLRVVMGHFYFGVHTFVPSSSTYLTMLRDPVDRVVSHYHFVRHQPSHYLYEAASRMSLAEYVQFCNRQEPNNDQVRLLAGNVNRPNFGTCTDDMLAAAKKNLASRFSVVGLTEEFDASVLLMKRTFGWRNPFYGSENIGAVRSRKKNIPPETLRLIKAYNTLDFELYRYARELFRAQLRLFGTPFDQELRRFRKLNASYGQFQLLLEHLRKKYIRSREPNAAEPQAKNSANTLPRH